MYTKYQSKKYAGNALLEFALVLPVLLIIIAGIVDFSLLFYDKAVITNASREGARYAVVFRSPTYASTAAVQTYTQSYLTNRLVSFANPKPAATVTVTSSTNPPIFGSTVTVTVAYVYTDILLHLFITHSKIFNLSATTTMAYE